MARQKFSNNGSSKLAGSLTTIATSLSVTATEGAEFPTLGAGDWFQATLVKLVGGLPVVEVVRVTARTGDNMTILRAQEGTLATTFSAGDVIELRPTAGGLDNMAQTEGNNTYTGSNTFSGPTTVPSQTSGDNSTKAANTAYVDAAVNTRAAKGANNDITSLSGLTTALSITQGGTGQTTGPAACQALGAVQQGTGIGQGANIVKLGWGSPGSGLRVTIDASDQGYLPTSSTNPFSGGTITYANPLTAQAANFTTVTASGLLSANSGMQVNNAAALMLGGATATLSNNGFVQIGGVGGPNLVFDTTKTQARNNTAAATLNLNPLGGLVQVGSGGLNVASNAVVAGRLKVQDGSGDDKIELSLGSTIHGYITAAAGHCFGAVNAAHNLQALLCDNSGNFTAAGNITAFSDETLKTNWKGLYAPGKRLQWLAKFSQVIHGEYERTDTGEVQVGAGARSMRKVLPKAVSKQKRKGKTAILTLNYGAAALMGAMETAAEVVQLRKDLDRANKLIAKLAKKLGVTT